MKQIIFISLMLLTLTTTALAGECKLNASKLVGEIDHNGNSKTLETLYSDQTRWYALMACIASGKRKWLEIGVRLRAVSDAGTSEQLDLAVGEALHSRPEMVLRVAIPQFSLLDVCSGPDVDDERFNSYKLSIAEINRRKASLKHVTAPDIANLAEECISSLEEAKGGIASFYGVK